MSFERTKTEVKNKRMNLKETVEESRTAAVVSASNISKGRAKMVVYESAIKADKN